MVDGSFNEGFCFREVGGLHAGCEDFLNQTRTALNAQRKSKGANARANAETDFCVLYRQNDRVVPLYYSRYDIELRRPTWVAFDLTWQDIGASLSLSVCLPLSMSLSVPLSVFALIRSASVCR